MTPQPAPKPGIYPGIPFDEYLSWEAISNTSLHPAARSMAHFNKRQPTKETRPMILGTLTHTAQFEPGWVNDRFAFMPDFAAQVQRERETEINTRIEYLESALETAENLKQFDEAKDLLDQLTKARKEPKQYERPASTSRFKSLVKQFQLQHADKVIISEQEFTDMIGMVRALSNDRRAKRYLTGGQYEVSIVAIDPVTGLTCKGRLDHLDRSRGDRGLITDLKSTQDASDYEKAISNWSYHRQLALYGDMLAWIEGETTSDIERAIVVVESSLPYCVRSAPLDEDALETGREEYRELLDAIAICAESQQWPGYANPDKWRLPRFHGSNAKPVNTAPAE